MAIPQAFERRLDRRKKLTGLLPGKLIHAPSGAIISGRPIDVSPNGLGLISSAKLEVGENLNLITADQTIHLQISWKSPDFGKAELNRFGLELEPKDSKINLEELFEKTGCLA